MDIPTRESWFSFLLYPVFHQKEIFFSSEKADSFLQLVIVSLKGFFMEISVALKKSWVIFFNCWRQSQMAGNLWSFIQKHSHFLRVFTFSLVQIWKIKLKPYFWVFEYCGLTPQEWKLLYHRRQKRKGRKITIAAHCLSWHLCCLPTSHWNAIMLFMSMKLWQLVSCCG